VSQALTHRLKKIKLLLLDVDGVLTQGQIVYDHEGKEIKFFHVHDGFAMVLFQKCGFKTAILTARYSQAVQARAEDLKVDKIIQNAFPKLKAYKELLEELGLKDEEVCFVADDLPDLAVFKRVGAAVAVPAAVKDIKEKAHYVTKKQGGEGAVREVIEMILKAQGKWNPVLESFR